MCCQAHQALRQGVCSTPTFARLHMCACSVCTNANSCTCEGLESHQEGGCREGGGRDRDCPEDPPSGLLCQEAVSTPKRRSKRRSEVSVETKTKQNKTGRLRLGGKGAPVARPCRDLSAVLTRRVAQAERSCMGGGRRGSGRWTLQGLGAGQGRAGGVTCARWAGSGQGGRGRGHSGGVA